MKDFRDFSILQASIQEVAVNNAHSMCSDFKGSDRHDMTDYFEEVADSEGDCTLFKGKDGRDTDGCLSLGLGEASGRVDVTVSVGVLLSSEKVCRSSQSVIVNPSSRVVKTIFTKGLDGHATTHRISPGTGIWELIGGHMGGMDVVVSCMFDTVSDVGIDHGCTLRCTERLGNGAQRFWQQQPDIPGQWTFSACGQERVWLVRNRCFLCGCPRGHDPLLLCALPAQHWSYWSASPENKPREPVIPPQPKAIPAFTSCCFGAEFFPLAQPLPAGLVVSGNTLPAFPAGSLDWLIGFLQSIMSPEDFGKYKGSFDPSPPKEEVPLALQLAKNIKERSGVLAQIEHERTLVSDFKTKYEKHTEMLAGLLERKHRD